jgi:hypothetical protein
MFINEDIHVYEFNDILSKYHNLRTNVFHYCKRKTYLNIKITILHKRLVSKETHHIDCIHILVYFFEEEALQFIFNDILSKYHNLRTRYNLVLNLENAMPGFTLLNIYDVREWDRELIFINEDFRFS